MPEDEGKAGKPKGILGALGSGLDEGWTIGRLTGWGGGVDEILICGFYVLAGVSVTRSARR